ncbi:ephexin-1-like [Ptychodera flava]|uniref:ephexin-1-like n=1 Tax=Ptychodera flava TaxID=63121 RepID=UPI00396A653D
MSGAVLVNIPNGPFSHAALNHYRYKPRPTPRSKVQSMASAGNSHNDGGSLSPRRDAPQPSARLSGASNPAVKPKPPVPKKPPVAKKPVPAGVASKLNAYVPPQSPTKPVAAVRPRVKRAQSKDEIGKPQPLAPIPEKRHPGRKLSNRGPGKISGTVVQRLIANSHGNSSDAKKAASGLRPVPPPRPTKSKMRLFEERRRSQEEDITTESAKLDHVESSKDEDEEWSDEDASEGKQLPSISAHAIPHIRKYSLKRPHVPYRRRQSRKSRLKSSDSNLSTESHRRNRESQAKASERDSDNDSTDSYDDVEVFEEISGRAPSRVKSDVNEDSPSVSPVKAAMAIFKLAEQRNNPGLANVKRHPKKTNMGMPTNRKKPSVRARKTSDKELVVLTPSPTRKSPDGKSSFVISLENSISKQPSNKTEEYRSAPVLANCETESTYSEIPDSYDNDDDDDDDDDEYDYEVMQPPRLSVSSNDSNSYVDPEEVDQIATGSRHGIPSDENVFSDPDFIPMYMDPVLLAPYAQASKSNNSSGCESETSTVTENHTSDRAESPHSSNSKTEEGDDKPPCPARYSSLMPPEFNILAAVTGSLPRNQQHSPSSSPPLPAKRSPRLPPKREGASAHTFSFEKLKDEPENNQKGTCGIRRSRQKSRYVDTAPMFQQYQREEKARATKMLRDIPEDEVASDPEEEAARDVSTYKREGTFQRTLWSELPEVRKSGLLSTLDRKDVKLQEMMFEVITSEASYLHSLNVFMELFVENSSLLSQIENKQLFSNMAAIRDVSERFLLAMENRQEENLVLVDICDIVQEFADKHFQCYVVYCSNQSQQLRTYQTLMDTSEEFKNMVRLLEARPACQGLPFQSFITLPMQRITRLPLLIESIFHHAEEETLTYKSAEMALVAIKKRVKECNEGARKMDRLFEMIEIQEQLKMSKHLALVSQNRWLIKRGELGEVKYAKSKIPFSTAIKPIQDPIHLIVFTDLVLITREKSDGSFVVEDHCLRNLCQVVAVEQPQKHPLLKRGVPANCMNIFILVLLENYKKKQREIILNCQKLSDRQRWMDVLSADSKEDDDYEDGRIYEAWDCPQVQCVEAYQSSEPDELSLEESDVINVFRKLPDGWYEGERLRDGERGWFPASYVQEILSQHVRAKNLRERYRLLCLSQCYIQSKFGNV